MISEEENQDKEVKQPESEVEIPKPKTERKPRQVLRGVAWLLVVSVVGAGVLAIERGIISLPQVTETPVDNPGQIPEETLVGELALTRALPISMDQLPDYSAANKGNETGVFPAFQSWLQ